MQNSDHIRLNILILFLMISPNNSFYLAFGSNDGIPTHIVTKSIFDFRLNVVRVQEQHLHFLTVMFDKPLCIDPLGLVSSNTLVSSIVRFFMQGLLNCRGKEVSKEGEWRDQNV